ncbi:MAG: hypothetical protein GQ570_03945 [Helicobacteraceae bacterium]|nr:hypothetical protein [Helicobacteraceae bacterium]
MPDQLFSNIAETTLASQLPIAATEMVLSAGGGDKFNSPTSGDYELITLIASDQDYEVVQCTGRVGDTLTIIREVEGVARQWEAGEKVSARITKKTMEDVIANATCDPIPSTWVNMQVQSTRHETDIVYVSDYIGQAGTNIYDIDLVGSPHVIYVASEDYNASGLSLRFPTAANMQLNYGYGDYIEFTLLRNDNYGTNISINTHNTLLGNNYSGNVNYNYVIQKISMMVGYDTYWTVSELGSSI